MKKRETKGTVKKIQPYPFDIIIELSTGKVTLSILRLVLHGILVDMKSAIFKPGDKFSMEFSLPAKKGFIKTSGKVIKTYDHFVGANKGSAAKRIAEIHFEPYPLPEIDRLKVKDFLKAIRQSASELKK